MNEQKTFCSLIVGSVFFDIEKRTLKLKSVHIIVTVLVGTWYTRRVQKETELFKYRANQHRERAAATERT